MIEFVANDYRILLKQIQLAKIQLSDLMDDKKEVEQAIFKNLDKGGSYKSEEFKFEVTEGPRRLGNPKGFNEVWLKFLEDNFKGAGPSYEAVELSKLIKKQETFKGPTLARLELALEEHTTLDPHKEEVLKIFGYKDGNRVEKIRVEEVAPTSDPADNQGHYCFSNVVGMKYREKEEGPLPWAELVPDEELKLVREPENEHDPNAVAVLFKNRNIGYIASEQAEVLAPLMDSKEMLFVAKIMEVKPNAIKVGIVYRKVQGA